MFRIVLANVLFEKKCFKNEAGVVLCICYPPRHSRKLLILLMLQVWRIFCANRISSILVIVYGIEV